MSPHTAVSSQAADLIAADAARYLDNVAPEKSRHLSMYTQTCLPPARLAVSTRLDPPPAGCEDPAWESLAAHEGFIAGADASPARQPTEVRVAHDDTNLYVHFVCPEPHPERLVKDSGEGPIYRADCAELYLDVRHDHHHYFQFSVTAGGVKQCQSMSAPLDSMRWERKVKNERIDLEWSADVAVLADRWLCRMTVPFESIALDPAETSAIGVNFARLRTDGFDEGSAWNVSYQGAHAPWAFGDLYLAAPELCVERTDLGAVKLWENRGALRLRSLSDQPLRATLRVEVIGGEDETDDLYHKDIPVQLAAGACEEIPFDFPFDRDEWRWTYLWLSLLKEGRTIYRGGYRFGRGQVGWLLAVDYRRDETVPPNPSADDPDFIEKKRAYIIKRQPAFERLTTAQGAESDFVLAAHDGSVRFDLMKAGALQRIAGYVYDLYDNDVDRLLGANFFVHQTDVMTYANTATRLADSMGALSAMRLGAGQCCVFANVLLGVLEKMKCEKTGRPYRGSRFAIPGHVTTVVEYDGRLVHLDPSIGRFYFLRDNRTLAGPDELIGDAELCLRAGKYLSRCYAENEKKSHSHYYRPNAGVFPPGAPAE